MASFLAAQFAIGALLLLLSLLFPYLANENSIPMRFFRGHKINLPPTFHATRTRTGHKLEPRPSTFWAFDALNPSDVVTSPWMPTAGLLCCRLGVLLYFVATFVAEAASPEGLAGNAPDWWWITYFTNWGMMLIGIQGLVGSVVTAMFVRHGVPEDLMWNAGLKLCVFLEQTSPTCAMLLTLFYWSILYEPADLDADNVLRHGGNVVVLLINSFASHVPFVSYHLLVTMMLAVAYTVLQWVYYGATGVWVYSALGLKTDSMAALIYYAILPVLFAVSFYIWFCFILFRDLLFDFACGKSRRPALHGGKIYASSEQQLACSGSAKLVDEEAVLHNR